MSLTLFRYLVFEMLKVFGMTSFAVAGLMSFAGLLRPLTRFGLDGSQVLEVWLLSLPVMGTYAVPIAALFASTFVYGRMASDNELTACRAAGMSYFGIIFPAMTLGFIMAAISLFGLSFLVPAAAARVEQTIYSNVSRLVVNNIDRYGSISLPGPGAPVTVYARNAMVVPANKPRVQAVRLEHVVIADMVNTSSDAKKEEPVPRQLFMAREATVFIEPPADDSTDPTAAMLRVWAVLEGGRKLPIDPQLAVGSAGVEAGLGRITFGPIVREPVVRQKSRMLDMRTLHSLLAHPEQGQQVREAMSDLVYAEQQRTYHETAVAEMAGGRTLTLADTDGGKLRLSAGKVIIGDGFVQLSDGIALNQTLPDGSLRRYDATEGKLKASPVPGQTRMLLEFDLGPGALSRDEGPSQTRQKLDRSISIAMPATQKSIAANPDLGGFLNSKRLSKRQRTRLNVALREQINDYSSEIHSRLSFAVSCLISVVIGATLGMLLKSGNYLSAFAVSAAPAALCIILIVTGKNIATNIPDVMPTLDNNPLVTGIALIWTGNATVLLGGGVLLWFLRRA